MSTKSGFLEDTFGILRFAWKGLTMPRRSTLRLKGNGISSVADDAENDETVVTVLAGGAGTTGQVLITADADHVVTDEEMGSAFFLVSGARTTNRLLTFEAPETNADAYVRRVRVKTTGTGNTFVGTGTGDVLSVPTGAALTIGFDTGGAFVVNTGA